MVFHVHVAPHLPLQVVVPVQRKSHAPARHVAVAPVLAVHTAQLAPHAVTSVAPLHAPAQRFVPLPHAVATQALPEHVVAVAFVGHVAHWPLQSRVPAPQVDATHVEPEHAVVAAPAGHAAQAPPHSRYPALHCSPHAFCAVHVAEPFAVVAQGVHELPQVTAVSGTQPLPQRR